MQHKLILVILDGWGIGHTDEHNAIFQAATPFIDSLWNHSPHAQLTASGEGVGLLANQIGSSEVGHMNIGAGRIIKQELTRLQEELDNETFYTNETFLKTIEHAKTHNSKLHFIGLLSDGGVHSHEKHLYALCDIARNQGIAGKTYIHAFLDGRDTPPQSAKVYLQRLAHTSVANSNDISPDISKFRNFDISTHLATLCGRYYAMDRNNDWHLTQRATDLLTKGIGSHFETWHQAIDANYAQKTYDEFIEPTILNPQGIIEKNDAIICFNFRPDRMRQILTQLFHAIPSLYITTMTPYGLDPQKTPTTPAYTREAPHHHLTETLAMHHVPHIKIAETQKYPHLTYFLNGTIETPYQGEKRIMVPSKDVPTFDLAPEMSAYEITTAALNAIGNYPVIMINYANADMVGHTGNITAGITACETIDMCMKRLADAAQAHGYEIIITADHGNAEQMYDPNNNCSHTAHTTNPVPFMIVSKNEYTINPNGGLANIAPTMLQLLNIEKPKEMINSLIL